MFLLKLLEEKLFPHLFQLPEATRIPGLAAPSCICKASNRQLCPSHAAVSLALTLLPPSSTFKDPCVGPTRIIQDHLPSSRSADEEAEFLFAMDQIPSRVLGIRTWTSLGATILPATDGEHVLPLNI